MANTTVNEIITGSQSDIRSYVGDARSFINGLQEALSTSFSVDIPDDGAWSWGTGAGLSDAIGAQPPRPSGLDFSAPAQPAAYTAYPTRDGATVQIPIFEDAAPELDIPERPTISLPAVPSEPSIRDVATPEAPSLEVPALPALDNVSFPSAPTLTLPTFEEQFPETPELLLKQDDFSFVEAEYSSPLLDATVSKLLNDVQNGGYGIEAADESALWERARDREYKQGALSAEQTMDNYAARGFPLPPGVALALGQRDLAAAHDRIASTNREISVARADLFRKAREFALSQGTTVEQMLITKYGFEQERALNAAKYAAEFGVTVFNVAVNRYNALVSGFAAYSSAYQQQVQALLAQTQIFKTQVEAAGLQLDANRSAVEVYRAQVAGVQTVADLYRTQMEAAQLEVSVERTKLDAFSSRVQAYVAQVGAQQANMSLYKTAVEGELVKTRVFSEQVSAFDARVRSAKVSADVEIANTTVDIENAKIALAEYQSRVEKYKLDVSAEFDRIRALVDVYGADQESYRALVQAWQSYYELGQRQSEANTRTMQENTKLEQTAASIELQRLVEEAKLRLGAASEGAGLYRDLIASLGTIPSAIQVKEEA